MNMKKYIIMLLMLLMPLNVFAYSDYIYRGGNTLGIEINIDGVLVVGFYQIDGKLNKSDLKVGDYIKQVNNTNVYSLKELTNEIEKYTSKGEVSITYERNNKTNNTKLKLIKEDGIYNYRNRNSYLYRSRY